MTENPRRLVVEIEVHNLNSKDDSARMIASALVEGFVNMKVTDARWVTRPKPRAGGPFA